jgi:hypothetical protein
MSPDDKKHDELEQLLIENQRLLVENNLLLKKLKWYSAWSFWFKVVWLLIIIGAPFVVYFFMLEPYFQSLGSSFDMFREGLQEVPGWKQFYESVRGGGE